MVFTVLAFEQIGILMDEYEEFMEENLVILKEIKWEDITEEDQ